MAPNAAHRSKGVISMYLYKIDGSLGEKTRKTRVKSRGYSQALAVLQPTRHTRHRRAAVVEKEPTTKNLTCGCVNALSGCAALDSYPYCMASANESLAQIDARIAEEENSVRHLARSNAELQAHLKETNDKELLDAVGENIVTIARKRTFLQLLYEQRRDLGGASVPAPPAAAPPPATALLSHAVSEARTGSSAKDDGGVYL